MNELILFLFLNISYALHSDSYLFTIFPGCPNLDTILGACEKGDENMSFIGF